MAFPLDSDTEAAILAGRIQSADLVDFYLKDGGGSALTLRCWNWPGSVTYPGTTDLDGSTSSQTYLQMHDRIQIAKAIRMAATLSAEPLMITLDASRADDNADWVGQFADATWHQMRVRVRSVMSLTTPLHRLPPSGCGVGSDSMRTQRVSPRTIKRPSQRKGFRLIAAS